MSHASRQHKTIATGFSPADVVLSLRGTQLAALVLTIVSIIITSGGAG
jgi:hypothetical protein